MNKKRFTTFLILALIVLALYRSQTASKSPEPVTKTNYLMGTVINLTVYDDVDESLFSESFKLIDDIESKMSVNIEGSDVDKINKSAGISPVEVSDETFEVIEESLGYSELSHGKFDVSSGGLVELWGIGSEDARVPSKGETESAVDLIDYRNITLDEDNKTVFLSKPGMMIDLGGIAKGYAADKVSAYLKSEGVEKAIVDVGGNLYLVGQNEEGDPWKVGVQNPFSDSRNEYLGVLEASDLSVVTSGVYERFLEVDGTRYHHILDPATGYPSDNGLMGVTILCESSVDADALSTSIFLLGLEDGMETVESLEGVEAIFVTDKKEIYTTSGMSDIFELTDDSFTLK